VIGTVAKRKYFARDGATARVLAAMLVLCAAPISVWGETGNTSLAKPGHSACDRTGFRVVVDVGHTADVPGARSARAVSEYFFNLRLAKQVEQALIEAGFVRTVLLLTTDPPRRGLFQRVERVNSLAADLLLSIHHDSVPDQFLETWEFEGEPYGFSDRFPGHAIFVSHDNADWRGSLRFGKLLGLSLKARGLQYTPHYTEAFMGNRRRELVDATAGVYRFDQLVVLRYARMPAVLLEAGSIINRDEELELRFPERRALITESVVDAVAGFCAVRGRRHPLLAATHRAKPGKRRALLPRQ
jgi:N-acetylmuramoyl-L-alanine amidase